MPYSNPAVTRLCDCRCPVHHGYQRTTFNHHGCACAITCATQPMTLLVEQWSCALFLDHDDGDLWFVNRLAGGQWDWSNADQLHEYHALYDIGTLMREHLLLAAQILRIPINVRRPDPA